MRKGLKIEKMMKKRKYKENASASGSDGKDAIKDSIEKLATEKETNQLPIAGSFIFLRNRWLVPGSREIFDHGLSKKSTGIRKRAIVPEIRVIIENLTTMPEIKELFEKHHFEWMNRPQGYYGQWIT